MKPLSNEEKCSKLGRFVEMMKTNGNWTSQSRSGMPFAPMHDKYWKFEKLVEFREYQHLANLSLHDNLLTDNFRIWHTQSQKNKMTHFSPRSPPAVLLLIVAVFFYTTLWTTEAFDPRSYAFGFASPPNDDDVEKRSTATETKIWPGGNDDDDERRRNAWFSTLASSGNGGGFDPVVRKMMRNLIRAEKRRYPISYGYMPKYYW
uniref:Uncharacterized protein n=1 Tax=Romanomermis culicivorax TaxID=13658 RepID=A0A915IIB8_ROMCU